MYINNTSSLADKFYGYEQRLTKLIEKDWGLIKAQVSNSDLETKISVDLYNQLKKNKELRAIGIPLIEHQLIDEDIKGDPFTKGKIDIVIMPDKYRDPDIYIAYECKRLNLTHKGKWSSLAGKYTAEGLARYVNAQYAKKLPVGCMLGYVMDGNIPNAHQSVIKSINKNKKTLKTKSIEKTKYLNRFTSHHSQKGTTNKIRITHLLLPI